MALCTRQTSPWFILQFRKLSVSCGSKRVTLCWTECFPWIPQTSMWAGTEQSTAYRMSVANDFLPALLSSGGEQQALEIN